MKISSLALPGLRRIRSLRPLLFSMAAGLTALPATAQSSLWSESFETDGNGTRYTATEFTDNGNDFFLRTDGTGTAGSYVVTGADGSFYFAGQDTDGEPQGGAIVSITFDPININGYTGLSFSGLFAEDDDGGAQDWDADALAYVEASIDGGAFTKVLQFAAVGGTNTEPGLDTDFDGVADGAALTSAFASFSAAIAGSGTLLTLKVTLENLNAGDEDLAFDLLSVEGTQTGGGCTDAAAPMAVCQSTIIYLDENGVATLDPADLDGGSSDDCTPAALLSFSASQTAFDCSDITGAAPVATDLLISEYIEGSGFTKYIEIFNGTGAAVDLSDYEIRLYTNGSSSANNTNTLTGMLNDGEVVVLANSQANEYTGATQVFSAVNFNGDDAVELYKVSTGMSVDIFGTIGQDPGSQWSDATSGNNTANSTLRRKGSVTAGVTTNPAAGFPTLGTEWNEFANNDVSGLGAHSLDGAGLPVTLTVTDESGKSSNCSVDIFVADNLGPNVICASPTVYLDENGLGTLTADMLDGGTSDNCSAVTLSIDKTSFDCSDAASVVTTADLFFSEYVEGSGFTKYVEVYNGTGATIDLADYEFRIYFNGSANVGNSQALSGTLDNGEVLVLANSNASGYTGAIVTSTSVNFNGDDALELYNTTSGSTVDIFGTIGQDPGSQWSDAGSGNNTANSTLRRKSSVLAGVSTNPAPGFPTLGTEWDEYANNDVSGLGAHSIDGAAGIEVTLTATDAYGNVSSCTSSINVVDNMAPVAICQDLNIQLDANGKAMIAEDAVDNGSYDNCSFTIDTDITSFTSANIGANPVVMTVTDASGHITSCTATVNVFGAGPAVFGFVLYDAITDQPIMPLADGAMISLPALQNQTLAIRALPGTDPLESMELILTGPVSRTQRENNAPYFSFGDNQGSGDVYGKGFKAGVYSFSATPYSLDGLKGTAGATQTISFEFFVPAPEVESFALVNPTTDQIVVNPMTDGEIVDLVALGGSFNIMANVNLGDIESVGMVITDQNGNPVFGQMENDAPYAVFGNYGNDFDPGTLPAGMYTISAVAFTENNGQGTASPIASVDFIVVDAAASANGNGGLSSINEVAGRDITLYPNPASFVVYADLHEFTGEAVKLSVMNELGQVVLTKEINEVSSEDVMINLSGNRFTEGVYLLQMTTESGESVTRRFVVSK